MSRTLNVYQIPSMEYMKALEFQRQVVRGYVEHEEDAGTLILLEHPPVITIGRSGTDQNIIVPKALLEKEGVAVYETNRGGDVTYHGPGQIVGYPILPLAFHGKDVHAYLRRVEQVLMGMLWEYAIKAFRREGLTGVWTERGKIANIGVAISHWVTWHGFALNVAPNLEHYKLINPCGLPGCAIASMEMFLGTKPPISEVHERIIAHFCAEFGFDEKRLLNHESDTTNKG